MPRHRPDEKLAPYRPLIPIDWDKVDEWLEYGCNGAEIAARLGVCADTLYDRTQSEKGVAFSLYAKEKRSKGDNMLREMQFKNARKGNVTMQIWLGKQRLDQKENPGAMVVPIEFAELFAETMKTIARKQKDEQDALEAQEIDLTSEDTSISSDN